MGDVYREIDLIEEVARIYGYNNIPTNTSISVRGSVKSKYELVEDYVRQFLIGIGYYEVKTFSIVDASPLQSVNLWSDKGGIDIANPLRQEESRLRTCLLPSLIRTKIYNMNHGVEQVRIFEIAKVYLTEEKLPQEKTCLSILADVDYLALKGIVESLLLNLGITSKCEWMIFGGSILFKADRSAKIQLGNVTVHPPPKPPPPLSPLSEGDRGGIQGNNEYSPPLPVLSEAEGVGGVRGGGELLLGNNVLGYLGEAKELELKTSPCMVELDMDLLVKMSNFSKNINPCLNILLFYVILQLLLTRR